MSQAFFHADQIANVLVWEARATDAERALAESFVMARWGAMLDALPPRQWCAVSSAAERLAQLRADRDSPARRRWLGVWPLTHERRGA